MAQKNISNICFPSENGMKNIFSICFPIDNGMKNIFILTSTRWAQDFTGIILCMGSANERLRYIVTSSLIGWAHTKNDSCFGWDTPHSKYMYKLNPLRAKFLRENINIYLQFMSFLHTDKTQVVEIPPRVRHGPAYST